MQVETHHGTFTPPAELGRWQMISLVVGVIGIAASVVGYTVNADQFMHSYLLGYLFWVAATMGCLVILMIQNTAGGAWGLMIRRLLEAGTRTLPLMILLFVPIILGRQMLYEWARPEAAQNQVLFDKSGYLNVQFWIIRAALFFIIWGALAFFLNRWSRLQDETAEIQYAAKIKKLSGVGILIFALTATFAGVDWIMSLAPEWYSTIFGMITMINWGLTGLAFITIIAVLLSRRPPLAGVLAKAHFHDYGKLLLAFVMLWAYLNLSQFLIIWSGNLPEEITWYTTRLNNGWQWVALLVVLFHFALPFLLLLSRDIKRNTRTLIAVAVLLFVMRLVDLYWTVEPQLKTGEKNIFHFSWMDIALPVGIGGVWLFYYFWQLRRMPLLPISDPGIEKAIAQGHEHH